MSTTDCVASEHGPQMKMKNYLNNQPKHIIGMRQTASTQVSVFICFKFCSGRKGLHLSPPLLSEPNTCFVYVSLFCPSVQKSCNPPPVSSISKGVAIIPNGVARIANGVARITLVLPRSHEFLMIGGITKLVWGSVARFVWFVRASFCFMCGFVSLCFVLCLTFRRGDE